MGGDDLGSDDEFLLDSDIGEADIEEESANEGLQSVRDDKTLSKQKDLPGTGVKRSFEESEQGTQVATDNGALSNNSQKKKGEKGKSGEKNLNEIDTSHSAGKQKFMLQASREIGRESTEVQAAFLWTCYAHALLGSTDADQSQLGPKFSSSCFEPWWHKIIQSNNNQHKKVLNTDEGRLTNTVRDALLPSAIKGALSSMKRMKKWSVKGSPMVLVVCVSARRCVALLKALSVLKVKCGKLFAKHLYLEQQLQMMKTDSFPIAVGTPNRLLKLLQEDNGLTLKETELLVVDGYESDKGFTVCTLKDTATDLANLFQDAVQPRMQNNPASKLFKILMS
jgi:superfamily II DNA/RNA helicase